MSKHQVLGEGRATSWDKPFLEEFFKEVKLRRALKRMRTYQGEIPYLAQNRNHGL